MSAFTRWVRKFAAIAARAMLDPQNLSASTDYRVTGSSGLPSLLTQIKSLGRTLDNSPFVFPVGIRIQIESHWQCEWDADEAGCDENHSVNILHGRSLLIPYACHLQRVFFCWSMESFRKKPSCHGFQYFKWIEWIPDRKWTWTQYNYWRYANSRLLISCKVYNISLLNFILLKHLFLHYIDIDFLPILILVVLIKLNSVIYKV